MTRPAPALPRPLLLVLLLLSAPGTLPAQGVSCNLEREPAPLPDEVPESSGVVRSRRHPGLFWTHNDSGGEPVLYGVDAGGRLLARVRVRGAGNRDWEDLALGPCPPGGEGDCLYIGDIGDNAGRRREIFIYRVPEPSPGDTVTAPAEALRFRFPRGPRNAEALFHLPGAGLFLVSKGGAGPATLYRVLREGEETGGPVPAGEVPPGGGPRTLEPVHEVVPAPVPLRRRITGGSATPDGRFVVLRDYVELLFFRVVPGDPPALEPAGRADLRPLAEPQGEGVDVTGDGRVVVTSESGPVHGPGGIWLLRCRLPAEGPRPEGRP